MSDLSKSPMWLLYNSTEAGCSTLAVHFPIRSFLTKFDILSTLLLSYQDLTTKFLLVDIDCWSTSPCFLQVVFFRQRTFSGPIDIQCCQCPKAFTCEILHQLWTCWRRTNPLWPHFSGAFHHIPRHRKGAYAPCKNSPTTSSVSNVHMRLTCSSTSNLYFSVDRF